MYVRYTHGSKLNIHDFNFKLRTFNFQLVIDMTYFVYIVECKNKSLYTGITTDTDRRLHQHNGEIKGGASYTRSHRPVTLRHVEECESKSEALKRELSIKKLTHTEKEILCSTQIRD